MAPFATQVFIVSLQPNKPKWKKNGDNNEKKKKKVYSILLLRKKKFISKLNANSKIETVIVWYLNKVTRWRKTKKKFAGKMPSFAAWELIEIFCFFFLNKCVMCVLWTQQWIFSMIIIKYNWKLYTMYILHWKEKKKRILDYFVKDFTTRLYFVFIFFFWRWFQYHISPTLFQIESISLNTKKGMREKKKSNQHVNFQMIALHQIKM